MKNFENICRALEYIDSHLNEPIDFENLADIFYFSPYYFNRMFSMITGKTIAAYIRERRLERACVQLSETDKTILEICLDCGFNSQQSFCRSFKNNYGLAPNEYRKQKYIPTVISVKEMIARFEKQLERSKSMSDTIMNDIGELTKKIELEPENADLYTKRGEMYYALKMYGNAKNDCIHTR